jgi:hypothetical protein
MASSSGSQLITATAQCLSCLDLRQGYAHKVADWHMSLTGDSDTSQNVGSVRSIGTCSTHPWLAAGSTTGHVAVLDQRTGGILERWHAHEAAIVEMFPYSGNQLMTVAADRTAALWRFNSATGQPVRETVRCVVAL